MKNLLRKIIYFFHYHLFHKHTLNKTQTERIENFTFTIPPTVFNPSSYISSKLFAEFVSTLELKNRFILDMGCGSGIISVFAASRGATCVAIDKNSEAVKSTTLNAKQNGFENHITVFQSDLFINIPLSNAIGEGLEVGQKSEGVCFDFIFFNPPYFKGNPESAFELGFKAGENYEVIKNFIIQSKQYLKPDRKIYLIFSSDMPYEIMQSFFKSEGFEFKLVRKHAKLFETFFIIEAFL